MFWTIIVITAFSFVFSAITLVIFALAGKQKVWKAAKVLFVIALLLTGGWATNYLSAAPILVAAGENRKKTEKVWETSAGVLEMWWDNCALPTSVVDKKAKSDQKLFVWFDDDRKGFILEKDKTLGGEVEIFRSPQSIRGLLDLSVKCHFRIHFMDPEPGTDSPASASPASAPASAPSASSPQTPPLILAL